MTSKNPLRVVQNVLNAATSNKEAQHVAVPSAGLDPKLACVREFQVDRIAQTYRDFMAQPNYAPVMRFFLEDLYAARDFSQRDYDAERAHNFAKKIVPAEMLLLATEAIELARLTNALDVTLLDVLVEQLEYRDILTPELYAEAYRRSNNVAEREWQIELLVDTMGDAASTAQMRLTGPALKLAKGPVHVAGWDEMYAFLERGYHAFSRVKKPRVILDAIRTRETEYMHHLLQSPSSPL